MKPQQFAIIGCRLLALYLFALLMNSLGQLWLTFTLRVDAPAAYRSFPYFNYAGMIVSSIVNAALCFFMWEKAPWVAKLLMKDAEPTEGEIKQVPAAHLFQAVGLLVVLFRLGPTSERAYFAFFTKQYDPSAVPMFWINFAVLIIALVFLIGAKRISTHLNRFWNPSEASREEQ
ncbi:MAG: hypothetical protein ABL962_04185 [Fimbriimonadaceae bacterium]